MAHFFANAPGHKKLTWKMFVTGAGLVLKALSTLSLCKRRIYIYSLKLETSLQLSEACFQPQDYLLLDCFFHLLHSMLHTHKLIFLLHCAFAILPCIYYCIASVNLLRHIHWQLVGVWPHHYFAFLSWCVKHPTYNLCHFYSYLKNLVLFWLLISRLKIYFDSRVWCCFRWFLWDLIIVKWLF